MRMLGLCVFMRMNMAFDPPKLRMDMRVVTIIVFVPVFMFYRTMGMKMGMLSDEKHEQGNNDE